MKMSDNERGFINKQPLPHPITNGEKLLWVFGFIGLFVALAAFAALCIFLSSLSAGRIPIKLGLQVEGSYEFVSGVKSDETLPKPCAKNTNTVNLGFQFTPNGEQKPTFVTVLQKVGVQLPKNSFEPELCFQTSEGDHYKIIFSPISTLKAGSFSVEDLYAGHGEKLNVAYFRAGKHYFFSGDLEAR